VSIHAPVKGRPKQVSNVWVVIMDSDRYKMRVHEGFRLQDVHCKGSLSLFGDDPLEHRALAEQVCKEVWHPEKSRYLSAKGKKVSGAHYLDCIYGCMVGAVKLGVNLIADNVRKKVKLSELQAQKRAERRR
ncbi:MAG: hypothetical protein GY839_11925, partial [candidate division Zixibacteria bacterium]|nr:hypothetical protein [candidate division Zixibacteria bacterium]